MRGISAGKNEINKDHQQDNLISHLEFIGQVMVERSDRMWSTGEGSGKLLQYSFLENPMNSLRRQNDRILKE